MKNLLIAPSLLAADFARLAEETAKVESGGADWIHVDVMDGHFVPNITVGPVVVEWLRKETSLPLDVHLMIEDPLTYAPIFIDAGADSITFHAEVVAEAGAREQTPNGAIVRKNGNLDAGKFRRVADAIRAKGKRVGIAVNPATPGDILADVVREVDLVLAMTVWPGFGGQKFIRDVMPKVRLIRSMAPEVDIQVDGGLNPETVPIAAGAGANVIVAGTATFRNASPAEAIRKLRDAGMTGVAAHGV